MALPRRRVIPKKRTKGQQVAYDKQQKSKQLSRRRVVPVKKKPVGNLANDELHNSLLGESMPAMKGEIPTLDDNVKDNISYAPPASKNKKLPRRRVIPKKRTNEQQAAYNKQQGRGTGRVIDDLDKIKRDQDKLAEELRAKFGNITQGPNGEMVRGPLPPEKLPIDTRPGAPGNNLPPGVTAPKPGDPNYRDRSGNNPTRPDRYTNLNPSFTGLATQAIIPAIYNGQAGFYTDGSKNTFIVDESYRGRVDDANADLNERIMRGKAAYNDYERALRNFNDRSRSAAQQRMIEAGGSIGPNGEPIGFDPSDRYGYEQAIARGEEQRPQGYIFSNPSLDPTRPTYNSFFESRRNNLQEEIMQSQDQLQELMNIRANNPNEAETADLGIEALTVQLADLERQLERQSTIRNDLNEYIRSMMFGVANTSPIDKVLSNISSRF